MDSAKGTSDAQFTARELNREYSCPVCLEEFQDPKLLPACDHSVCKQCLEKIVDRIIPASIQCPVCRRESLLEEPGVDQLTTNNDLVSELRRMNFEKQKKGISNSIESAKEQARTLEKLLEDFEKVKELRMKNADQAKEEVKLATSRFIDAIRKSENDLCLEVDNAMNKQLDIYNTRQSEVKSLLERTNSFVTTAEQALQQGEINKVEVLKTRTESDLVEGRAHEELLCYASMEIKFEPNQMSLLEKNGLGKISVRDYASAKAAMYNGSVPLTPIPRHVGVVHVITPSDLGFESFSPLTIATDGQEFVAVSDPENNNILLLDRRGCLVRRITAATPMMFSGVAFTKDKTTLIAVNGGRGIHYLNPEEGTFKVTYKGNSNSGLKYCFLTTDTQGRTLLTCEPSTKTSEPCVVVYSETPLGNPELTLGSHGDGSLLFPFKAWYLKGEYFVSDMEKGCIMVYDQEGTFTRHFGGKDAKVTGPGSPGRLVLPTGMAPHPQNDTLFVCDWGSSSVQIYTMDGAFTDFFLVGGRPTDIAILDDGTIFVSSKDDQWIKILSLYT